MQFGKIVFEINCSGFLQFVKEIKEIESEAGSVAVACRLRVADCHRGTSVFVNTIVVT